MRVPITPGEATQVNAPMMRRRKLKALVTDENVPGCTCEEDAYRGDCCEVCEAWCKRMGVSEERCYVCPKCERVRPWSNGASDDTPALCDDCAVEVNP